jgi:hypothetical protein
VGEHPVATASEGGSTALLAFWQLTVCDQFAASTAEAAGTFLDRCEEGRKKPAAEQNCALVGSQPPLSQHPLGQAQRETPPFNRSGNTLCSTSREIVSSKAKGELGALFRNGKELVNTSGVIRLWTSRACVLENPSVCALTRPQFFGLLSLLLKGRLRAALGLFGSFAAEEAGSS